MTRHFGISGRETPTQSTSPGPHSADTQHGAQILPFSQVKYQLRPTAEPPLVRPSYYSPDECEAASFVFITVMAIGFGCFLGALILGVAVLMHARVIP